MWTSCIVVAIESWPSTSRGTVHAPSMLHGAVTRARGRGYLRLDDVVIGWPRARGPNVVVTRSQSGVDLGVANHMRAHDEGASRWITISENAEQGNARDAQIARMSYPKCFTGARA